MMYATFTVQDRDYKARLSAKNCVDLEKKLGTNPLNKLLEMLMEVESAANSGRLKLPSLEVLIIMLHASLQTYEHSITIDKTYDIYDEWTKSGHSMLDLMAFLVEVFEVSGFIPEQVFEQEVESDPNA